MIHNILTQARNIHNPQAQDILQDIVHDFCTMHGDRLEGDDAGVICGVGMLGPHKIAVIAQTPGHSFDERMHCNSGMTRPKGYRKMQRMLSLGEKFHLPLLALIDTPGADASVASAQRHQSAAIAQNMQYMSRYPYPSIALILNQGMSGGAMAMAMCDRLWMMQHAVFSVINPEGCASILWHDASQSLRAASLLKITAEDLYQQGIIDLIVKEYTKLSSKLIETFSALQEEASDQRLIKRRHRFDRKA